ncbi:MAG: AMP-binding protein [Pseudomonadota bacterium]
MDKPWLNSYPDGVPEDIPTPPFQSVRDMVEHPMVEYPDRVAYVNMGTSITYRELDELSLQFACYLQSELGLVKGERIAIMLPNILQYPVAMSGALRAGLVVVNVNPLYTARELKHQLKDSGAKCIVILENFASTLANVIADTDVSQVVTTGVGDLLKFPKGAITNFVLRRVKKAVPSYSFDNALTFKQALKRGAGKTLKPVELGFADLAFLQYTGGTTGVSKGAMLSNRNLVFNVHQARAWQLDAYDGLDQIRAITALPLYHIFSLQSNCLCMMVQGGQNILITNPKDMVGFVKELSQHEFHFITGVNTLFAALLNTPGFTDLDFSSLRLSIGGGMAVQEAVSKQWAEVTGHHIMQGYGLTETSPSAIVTPLGETNFTGSIGLPIPSTDVHICDEDGRPLPVGEIGEICIRGPQVMEGYWQRPEETEKVMLPGGWLRTGDVGRADERGFFFIEDRKKDMILVSGFNVYPNEIEGIAVEMPGVLEAAAIGKPHPKSGEVVKLFIVKTDPAVTEQDVIKYCRENLTGYKVPKEVEFRDDLPKTNVGKILRRELRDEELGKDA